MMLRLRLSFALALLVFSTVTITRAGFRGASYSVKQVMVSDSTAAPGAAKVPAVEFVVTSQDRFPARALDPVLHVGKVEVRQYRYVDISNKTLIFTLFDLQNLEDDAPVYLQYGNDKRTRTDLSPFRMSMMKSE
jgi:hypothetical protein